MLIRKWLFLFALLLAISGLMVLRETLLVRSEDQAKPKPLSTLPTTLPYSVPNSQPQSTDLSTNLGTSPTCYNPKPNTGTCYIEWSSFFVDASPHYVISMTVSIDGRIRAYSAGFFQSSMVIPAPMLNPGFMVTCGFPSSSGSSQLGNTYSYIIRARDSAGAISQNSGTVSCPADVVTLYLPLISRH